MDKLKNKFVGCFVGLAVGDALGARYEGGYFERLLWKIIGTTTQGKLRFTDDTQMSLDLGRSLLINNGLDQKHLASTFANSYRWSRGYGPGTAWLLKKIRKDACWQEVNCSKFEGGSYGNGAAMRAPILAMYYFNDILALQKNIILASEITHAHPLAIEGARLIARVSHAALRGVDNKDILESLAEGYESIEYRGKIEFCIKAVDGSMKLTKREIKKTLGNSIAALDSSVTAIYFALTYRSKNMDDMLEGIFNLGGDADTIAAMAGAIWGAFNGADLIADDTKDRVEDVKLIAEYASKIYDTVMVSTV